MGPNELNSPPTEASPWVRTMELRVDQEALANRADGDTRLPVALSSEHPVRRYDWRNGEYVNEVLDHSPDSVDLSRVEDGAPFLLDHYRTGQIGKIEDIRVDEDRKVRGWVRFGSHPDAEWVRKDMEAGIRTKISAGYIPDMNNAERTQKDGELPTLRIKRWTLLEGSSVAIPADPTVGVGRGLDRGTTPATPTLPPESAAEAEERTMETETNSPADTRDFSQENAEIMRMALEHDLAERAPGWVAEGLTPDEVGREILKALAKRNAAPTPPAPDERNDPEAPAVIASRTPDEPGLMFGRAAFYLALGRGDANRAEDEAKRAKDPVGIRALAAGDAEAGGFLVNEEVAAETIELLRPASVVRRLNPVIAPMTNGKLRMNKLTGGASSSYIGENRPAPATKQTFGGVVFDAKKLATLVPISNDLLRRASVATDRLIRDDAVASMAQRSDLAFLRGAGDQFAPKGLRNHAVADHVISMTASPNLATVTADLHRAIQTLEEANVRMLRPGFLFAPREKHYLMALRDGNGNYAFKDEMLRGTLLTYPFQVSNQIPTNLGGGTESELILADFADVVIGETMGLLISMSNEAAYVDENQNLVSAFSNDQTVLRVIQEHDLQMRHDESIVVINELVWSLAA